MDNWKEESEWPCTTAAVAEVGRTAFYGKEASDAGLSSSLGTSRSKIQKVLGCDREGE